MAKQLLYTDAARRKNAPARGRQARPRRRHHARADRPQHHPRARAFGGPTVTKDGVSVSKEIDLPDPFENMGAKLVNAVASEDQSDSAGDGTTTATILALSHLPVRACATSPRGPTRWRSSRGIDKAVAAVCRPADDQDLTKRLTSKKEADRTRSARHQRPTTTPTIGAT